jgi:NADH dehydrogenase FAD-containing subunit
MSYSAPGCRPSCSDAALRSSIFDQDLVASLIEHSRHVGIDVRLNTSVTSVDRRTGSDAGPLYRVHIETGGHADVVEADPVVHDGGRVPNTDTIDAEPGGITIDAHGGVAVNEYLQSVSNPRVDAAGDAVLPPGAIPLTRVASHEGAVIAANLLQEIRNGLTTAGYPASSLPVRRSPPSASPKPRRGNRALTCAWSALTRPAGTPIDESGNQSGCTRRSSRRKRTVSSGLIYSGHMSTN